MEEVPVPFDPTKCRILKQQAFFNILDGGAVELKTNGLEAGWPTVPRDQYNQYLLARYSRRVENVLVDLTGRVATPANGLKGALTRTFVGNSANIGRIEFVNCGFINVARDPATGAHTEGMFVSGAKFADAPGFEIVFDRCRFHSGSIISGKFVEDGYGWHHEDGSVALYRFIDCDVSWRLDMNLTAGHKVGRIEYQNCRATGLNRDPKFTVAMTPKPGFAGLKPTVVELSAPVTPPPPPVDPHADCNARIVDLERALRLSNTTRENTERALAAMEAERDELAGKVARMWEALQ
jgi:hypothetical protein